MKSLFTHNPGLKALALGLAVWIWYESAYEPELAAAVSIPIEYRNLPRDLEIASGFTTSAMLEVRGPASRLRRVSDGSVAAVLDLGAVHEPGELTFGIGPGQIDLPRDVSLVRVIPAQVHFGFERRVTRDAPVAVRFTGTLAPGLRMTGYEPVPRTLQVTGPSSAIDDLDSLQTDPINLTAIRSDTDRTVSVFAGASGVRFVSTPRVIVKVHIEKSGN